ncbi:hypothetical protein F2Q68_00039001 [Brassica cretica]|uniref:Uncharacterized protein n=1 Tax=Brassica cretica TaxID=69181 RepID=A0A8S9M9S5_BRACR|nr:hypothetical protein F2Q68_00039001 [Brassica cretica]
MSHFEDGGLSFPLPRFLLEALAELKMAFTQMAPNLFRFFLASWVQAQEEGLEFGHRELKQLFAIKRNNGFPGTIILAPRSGRIIIEGIPNKDDQWRERFFVFKVNPASVGDFDFERIPREWSDDIEPFGPAPMTPELPQDRLSRVSSFLDAIGLIDLKRSRSIDSMLLDWIGVGSIVALRKLKSVS